MFFLCLRKQEALNAYLSLISWKAEIKQGFSVNSAQSTQCGLEREGRAKKIAFWCGLVFNSGMQRDPTGSSLQGIQRRRLKASSMNKHEGLFHLPPSPSSVPHWPSFSPWQLSPHSLEFYHEVPRTFSESLTPVPHVQPGCTESGVWVRHQQSPKGGSLMETRGRAQ